MTRPHHPDVAAPRGPGLARAGRASGGAFRSFARASLRDSRTEGELLEVYARGDGLERRAWAHALRDELGDAARPLLARLAGWEGEGAAARLLRALGAEAPRAHALPTGVALRADGPDPLWLLVWEEGAEIAYDVRGYVGASSSLPLDEALDRAARLLWRMARKRALPPALARFAALFDPT